MSPTGGTRFFVLMAVGLVPLSAGCMFPLHKPPPEGKPAGTLKFRINHHHNPGGSLSFQLLIDGNQLPHDPPLLGPSGTWTRAAPGWRRLDIRSAYFTTYPRVMTQRHIRYLGTCHTSLAVHLAAGRSYLFDYSYLGRGSCRVTCHVQVFTSGEQFRLEPCPFLQSVKPMY